MNFSVVYEKRKSKSSQRHSSKVKDDDKFCEKAVEKRVKQC